MIKLELVYYFLVSTLTLTFISALLYKLSTFKQVPAPNTLTHAQIRMNLKTFEHSKFNGVCYGFVLNWAATVALNQEQDFYRQINQLRLNQDHLLPELERIQHIEPINQADRVLKSLPILFKRICITQSPENYQEYYGKHLNQLDINPILSKITSANSNVQQVYSNTHTFTSQQDMTKYFELLMNLNLSERIAVVISTFNHAMGCRRYGGQWHFIDINDLYKQTLNRPYFIFNNEEVAKNLYLVSKIDPMQTMTVHTDFIAIQSEDHLKTLSKLDNIFPDFSLCSLKDKNTLFKLAARHGDLPNVKKCLQAKLSFFPLDNTNTDSPMLRAISNGRRDAVKLMINSAKHSVNNRIGNDHSTLLHRACQYLEPGIVEELLNIEGIQIDPQDDRGRTPLMLACYMFDVGKESQILRLLLAHGASLDIKNNHGNTAEDTVRVLKYKTAMQIFKEFRSKQHQEVSHGP